jgi:PAS domain S-box-containing protein
MGALLRESVERTHVWDTEFRVVWPNGSIRWLLGKGRVFLDGLGRPVRMVGINFDITERKQAEAALRESEERFRNMADTAPVMIWVIGPDKLCTFFNKRWLDFTGRTMEQELGSGWVEGVHPEDLEKCNATYSSAFDTRCNFQMELRLRRADGEYRSVLCSGVPRFTGSGVFAGYVGCSIDITDLKRAQEEALARQKLESLGVLAGGIAHDFNNLLGSILADAEMALADLRPDMLAVEEIQRIKSVALRASEIVRELMIYAGQETVHPESLDLSRLVDEMLQLLKVSISKHAVLKTDLGKNLPAMQGNAAQMRQVLMNLITNASEAIGEHQGEIHVTTELVKVPEGEYVRLEVSDTGCGMSAEIRAKIFEPFYTTKFAGRGLGMAVVIAIVRSHGGAIDVRSVPGQGTKVQILLPCGGPPAKHDASATNGAGSAPISTAAGTVLLVEDEETLRLSVSKMLRKNGFSIIEVGDGSAAIDLLHRQTDRIDLILLDLTLPGTSSREVIAESLRIRPDMKIILTSAYAREMAMPSIDSPQVKGFIRKPFKLEDVVQLLRYTLSS